MANTVGKFYPPAIIKLNPSKTHGRYIALNWVPNQKFTIVSLFNWHQTYSTLSTIGSIRYYGKIEIIIIRKKIEKVGGGGYLLENQLVVQ